MKNENVAAAKPVDLRTSDGGAWRKSLGGIASALSAALALNCPACIPALSALLSSLGVGFAFVRWVLILLLLVGVASIAWAAKLHGRWWVLAVGIFGAALIYSGRYVWFSPAVVWVAAAGMVGASVANFMLKRQCCRCAEAQPQPQEEQS
jgi:hypothetical protein